MELLVVLLIIGILSTVALRTIDATRDRSLFDQTTKEMNQLIQAIVGNPDLTYDGRRVDFGYFGDMEELPHELKDLVRNPGSTAWHGPYLRMAAGTEDSSYRFDGWGHEYTYNPNGTISTDGNGKFPMTMNIVDSDSQLYFNTISGTVTDHDDNPPATVAGLCTLRLYYNNQVLHPTPRLKIADMGGFYQYSPASSDTVPIGIHKLVAHVPGESLVRWVTVLPRSQTVVDFKFSKSFWNKLRLIGSATTLPGGSGFVIKIANDQSENITIDWLVFKQAPDSAFMRDFTIRGNHPIGFPLTPADPGIGLGDTVHFAPVTIGPNLTDEVELQFLEFHVDRTEASAYADVSGKTFKFRFSDGSEITVNP
jgi:hypothetical protein